MEKIVKEYNSWLKDHQNFILHLKKHESSLFLRIQPIYEVLNFLSNENLKNDLKFSDDLYKIFQIGLEYINSQIFTCKLYLEKYFNQDFHAFMGYEQLVGYILYLEDLRYEMKENKIDYNEQLIHELTDYLEHLMEIKDPVPDNINLYIDSEVHKIVDTNKFEFKSIIDIFVEISDTLGIDSYSESEYVIGKDI